MKISKIVLTIYVGVVTIAGLFLVEIVSREINLANGIDIPLLKIPSFHGKKDEQFLTIDPHLGYARGNREKKVSKLQDKYTWIEGLAVYNKKGHPELEHPIILAMGGSTTDAVQSNQSWPEELSKLLAEKGISATVVNGGTGGYSTNQELLKLVRDGVEFDPDIIISYSGV